MLTVHIFIPYLITTCCLVGLDIPWLLIFTLPKVNKFLVSLNVSPVYASPYRLFMTSLLYSFLGSALYHFAVQKRDTWACVFHGAQLGFVTFGVFDLTTSVFFGRAYPLSLLILDPLWGTFLCAASSLLSASLLKRLGT